MGLMLKCSNKIKTVQADMNNDIELNQIILVLEKYKMDGMGDSPPFSRREVERLKHHLISHPSMFVFLIYIDNIIAGGSICFNTFSSFTAKNIINIHDLFILKEFRGLGLGRKLMACIIDKACELNCSKITLEVREDNVSARKLYSSLGFSEATPIMNFWSKPL